MSDSDVLDPETRSELEALLTEFAYRIDHGRADRVHELFTEDGYIRGPGLAMQSRAGIAAQFGERARDGGRVSRHFWSNPRFEKLDDGAVRITTAVQTFIHRLGEGEELPAASHTLVVGDSVDVAERGTDGKWRFRSRELIVAFRG